MAVHIKPGAKPATLINPHFCQPAQQQALVDTLVEGVQAIYRHAPGFISASILRSQDGTRVTNYAQYESPEAARAVRHLPGVPDFAARVGKLAEGFDLHLYDVAASVTGTDKPVLVEAGASLVTLVDVHHCTPDQQAALTEKLAEAVRTVYRHESGFISASIHQSLDQQRVTNLAQWESREAFAALRGNEALAPYRQQVGAMMTDFDGMHLYEVAAVITA